MRAPDLRSVESAFALAYTIFVGMVPLLAGGCMQQPAQQCASQCWRAPGQGHQSARAAFHSLPGVPQFQQLEADPLQPRVQSRSNGLSVARHASEGGLHAMPHQPGLQEREYQLRRLPRRYSSPPVRSQLRELPHGEGMAGLARSRFATIRIAFRWSARMRCCNATTATRTRRPGSSRASRRRATPATRRTFKLRSSITCGWLPDHLRNLPHRGHMVQCEVRPSEIHGLCAYRRAVTLAVHGLPLNNVLHGNSCRLLSPATQRTSTAARIHHMCSLASPRSAPPATQPPTGSIANSITRFTRITR